MAILKKFSTNRFKQDDDTGFGNRNDSQSTHLLNKDGTFNVARKGLPMLKRLNVFHELITLPWWKFNLLVFAAYLLMNTLFAGLYLAVGMEEIEGDKGMTASEHFWDAFFFSAQTLTTVGYGRQNPIGFYANIVSAVECLIGLMSFALMTGLLYSRFSRPVARLLYSENMLISPYKEGKALMFRIANQSRNQLIECEAELMVSLNVLEQDRIYRRFFPLKLERNKINSLSLSWTIVHPLDENSPLYQLSKADLKDSNAEFIFMFKAFDDTYSQHVHTRYSYMADELIDDRKFSMMYERSHDGSTTVLNLDRINDLEEVSLQIN